MTASDIKMTAMHIWKKMKLIKIRKYRRSELSAKLSTSVNDTKKSHTPSNHISASLPIHILFTIQVPFTSTNVLLILIIFKVYII